MHALDRFLVVAVPMVLLIAGATLWTGWVFWRYALRTGSTVAMFVALAFTLWGLHHLDYPFLRARGGWTPWGYFLDIVFELAVGIGFGMMVLSELARRLAARTDELGRLQAMMVSQHEAERRRLSRELHDETAQTLSAVKLEIGMVREDIEPDARVRLDHVLDLVDGGIRGIRRVINDLRPALLDDLGLVPAIRSLAADVSSRGELDVELDLAEPIPRLAPDTELAFFRAAQEALANVVRHAGRHSRRDAVDGRRRPAPPDRARRRPRLPLCAPLRHLRTRRPSRPRRHARADLRARRVRNDREEPAAHGADRDRGSADRATGRRRGGLGPKGSAMMDNRFAWRWSTTTR